MISRPQWFASRCHASIVPDHAVELGAGLNGGGRNGHAEWRIHDPIEINAVALWRDDGPPTVLLSFDLLYPGQPVVNAVHASLPGIPVENILIAASHTHAAPMTDDAKPSLGSPDPAYLDSLTAKIREVAALLLDPVRRRPVTLEVGQSHTSHAVNRRRRFPFYFADGRILRNAMVVAPNPEGTTDDTLSVAVLRDAEGELFAVLWNYACHPVGFPLPRTVSAHFPGTVRQRIRKETRDDRVAVLYFQGFSGDLRPRVQVHPSSPANRARRILFGYGPGHFDADELTSWAETLADVVIRQLEATRQPVKPSFAAKKFQVDGNDFAEPTTLDVGFQRQQFGEELAIVAMSAEVVHEYADYVRSRTPTLVTMCVGCVDAPLGYIPTRTMLREGGYEAGEFCRDFALRAVNPAVEEATKQAFDRLLSAGL